MKRIILPTALFAASLALSACGGDSECDKLTACCRAAEAQDPDNTSCDEDGSGGATDAQCQEALNVFVAFLDAFMQPVPDECR
ncbi:MAG: hypothetical protein AAFZ18_08975 [Myxococcota bacterium]